MSFSGRRVSILRPSEGARRFAAGKELSENGMPMLNTIYPTLSCASSAHQYVRMGIRREAKRAPHGKKDEKRMFESNMQGATN
jgi:hypothetical protein